MTDITARLAKLRSNAEKLAGSLERESSRKDIEDWGKVCSASATIIRELLSALTAYESERVGWQPIQTAPRGVDVLLCCPRAGVVRGRWQPDTYTNKPRPYWTHDRERLRGVRETRADQPTHWQPLPAAPVQP